MPNRSVTQFEPSLLRLLLMMMVLAMTVLKMMLKMMVVTMMVLFVMAVAAAETAIGLAIFVLIYRKSDQVDLEKLDLLKG